MASTDPSNPAHVAFDNFIQAQSSKEVQRHFKELCTELQINPRDFRSFYSNLKDKLNYWKAKALWTKLDKRACLPEYQQRKACDKNKCLILGAGPCGLRAAIELSLLGAQVLVLEKRLDFSRNNVLHLWPFTIHDLRALGAKKFYGKFCTGALDHISIRQLQLILLKVSLLFGVEVHTGVEFQSLIEPSGDKGWMAKLQPASHPASAYEFDVFISAGGGKFVPEGFKHKELRGKLAIGITANFINRNSAEETQVAEISGVARIYNQKFFQQLLTNTGIDLENIVYYKDDTHYFVMTAKKKSLLSMGVIKKDQSNAEDLLAPTNVDFEALRSYAYKAADFSTGHKLPEMQFAQNHAGQADVAMFDFTCMYRAENASLVRERKGKKLLLALVGDCLVEPFWPLGTGIARGFLGAFDAAWMVRSWGMGVAPLKVVAERESIYQLLSQTTPQNTSKRYSDYTINPRTRYTRVNMSSIHANQVQHLHMVDNSSTLSRNQKKRETHMRQDSVTGLEDLLKWCQKHTLGHKGVSIKDFTHSWRSGLALCALIHHFRPKLIDMSSLEPNNAIHNNQLAVNIIQKELGIPPALSAADLANSVLIDKLSMVLYLTQIRDAFAAKESTRHLPKSKTLNLTTAQAAVFFLSKLKNSSLQRNKETLAAARQTRERQSRMGDEGNDVAPPVCPEMEHSPEPELDTSGSRPNSETCFFCAQRVYALERISAEGKFFHRSCFTCSQCGITLRLGGYIFDQKTGRFYCELHAEEPEQHNGPGITRREDTGGGEDLSSDDYTLSPSDEEFGPDHQSQQKPDRRNPDSEEEDAGTLKRESVKANKPKTEEVHPHVFYPVPKPRHSKQGTSSPQPSPPVAKPRNILLSDPSTPDRYSHTDSRPKLSLRKLQLSVEEKSVLGNLQSFSADSDSETPGGSSSCSSSSMTASGLRKAEGPDGPDEEGYWSGSTAGYMRDRRNRRCFKKREVPAGGQNRVRSKFSPWNLSSPRISRDSRLSVLVTQPGRVETTFRRFPSPSEGVDGDDDDDDDDEDDDDEDDEDEYDFLMQENSNYLEKKFSDTEKLELRKMRTLERRAKMSEIQRFREAQSIQRRLDEIEETFRDLEEKGVVLEQTLRGEEDHAVDASTHEKLMTSESNDGSPEAIDEWIHLVHEKNTLMSEESELMVQSRQLELEDKQSMLDLELRKFMEIQDKTPEQKEEEERILQKIVEVVDMRNSLVSFLEDKRLKELEEQQFLSVVETKRHSTGAQVHWL